MRFRVQYFKKVDKQIDKLPPRIKQKLFALIADLEDMGPARYNWPNFSKLGPAKDGIVRYHCHLHYSWVACWTHKKDTIQIEVYYVGSRESAPYA